MNPRITADGRRYRTVLAGFVFGLALGLIARELVGTAYAQVMDPGQQRLETNQGIAQLNAKVDEILGLLRTGTLKVRMVQTDKTDGTAPIRPGSTGPVLETRSPATPSQAGDPAR